MNSLQRRFQKFLAILLATFPSITYADGRNQYAGIDSSAKGKVVATFLQSHCVDCHNQADPTAELDLESLAFTTDGKHSATWETVVRRLRTRQMPPEEMSKPEEAEYRRTLKVLEASLDRLAAANPKPGTTETFRRLTRTEYANAIRDLLALEIDVKGLLPKDESSHGFDNVTVGELSPTLLNRYISAAQKMSRLAAGGKTSSPLGETFRVPADRTQEKHVVGLPLGTRGGTKIKYHFLQDGEYEVTIRLTRDRNEEVEGLRQPHQLYLLLDREKLETFTVKPPKNRNHSDVDAHLKARIHVEAGTHDVGVTFEKKPYSLLETKRQPFDAHFNRHRHPRLSPAIYQVSITGPYHATGPGETKARQQVFITRPSETVSEDQAATAILSNLMRRAYRRPIVEDDLVQPMTFFHQARAEGSFDEGIEAALAAILVNPNFLFRVEQVPEGIESGTPYKISNIDLASRLSFFLWSSIPDEELLTLAETEQLSQPEILKQQVLRMLADDRASSLTTNFASQWLYLRNLESITPDLRLFPDFDDNLRQAMRRETELLFHTIVGEDRSALDLLDADFTFLNERLAKHYGIPNIYGSHFRRVNLDSASRRGGILRHGSILTVTSYATRTSPVIRGHWILKNLIGSPPPPPPPNVPALEDNTVDATLSVRDRLEAHRANPACSGCHNQMDPVGFALENFDALGRWREIEAGEPIDSSGGLPDGTQFDGVDGLEDGLLARPELFVGTLTEKLLTFALGRGIEPHDAPAIRKIVHHAEETDYQFSSIILGITQSTPFQMRTAP